MRRYVFGWIGLALLAGALLAWQAPARAGDAACNAPGCCTADCHGCSQGGCHGCSSCDDCKCCPQCGCKMVPVCHPYCENKTITKHEFCCHCKDHCVPGPEHCCKDCDGCCHEECCHCAVRQIHKLAVIVVCEQEPVRKCTVEWCCPRCSGQASAAPAIVTPAPANPSGPHVAPPPPPPVKTTSTAPMPGDLSTATSP